MREGTRSIPVRAFVTTDIPEIQPREGLRLGRYELVVPIAQGGMAEVWIARLLGDLGFSRIVALKTIRPEYAQDPSFRKSFFEEARIAARVLHANVVEVLDLGEEGPILFQVMRLIEGDSVAKLLRLRHERMGTPEETPGLPIQIAVRVMCDALAGLHAAHELADDDGVAMQLVHRDVTPHNILVGIDGVARLSDFGVAKALGRLVDETEAGQVRGKPGYFAPEQLERRALDRRVDIFAAGIVLWEAITGKHLFRNEETRPAQSTIDAEKYPDPRSTSKEDVPQAISDAVMRALAKKPEDRFATAAEMSVALEQAARSSGGPASASEVAQFVTDLSGHRVMMQRSLVKRAAQKDRAPSFAPAGVLGSAMVEAAPDLAKQLSQPAQPEQLTPAPITVVGPPPKKRPDATTAITDFIPVPIIRPRKQPGMEPFTMLKLGFAIVGALLLMLFLKRFVFSPRPSSRDTVAAEGANADGTLANLPQDRALLDSLTRSATVGTPQSIRTNPPEHKRGTSRGRSRNRGRGR